MVQREFFLLLDWMTEMNFCISKKDGIFVSQNKNAFAMLVIQNMLITYMP